MQAENTESNPPIEPLYTAPSNSTPLPPEPPTPPQTPQTFQDMPPSLPPRIKISTGRSFPYGTALIALVVIAASAGALYAFSGAKVEVTPVTHAGTVTGSFTATQGTGDLPFTVIKISKTATASVAAESTQTSNDSAQGTITIYNAQPTAQTLINNTRFATASGLVFRIHSPVTIPPTSNGRPGSVSATVFADQPGQAYNVGPSDFIVPGLKGGSTYTLVTAKSSTSMSGGFSGTRPSVSQTTDDSQHAALQSALASTMQTALATQIPSGSVVIPGGTFMSYQGLPDTATSTNSVVISEQGNLTAIVFPEDALAKAIAYKSLGTYAGEPVSLKTPSTLSLTPEASTTDFSNLTTFGFSLSGNATMIWKVDTAKIAGAVAGKTREAAQSILAGFPEVDKAVLTLRPFWASTFPQDPSRIHIIVDTISATK